jgi:hypothetical protein
MTNDLGVWTADDCARVLIDYQNEVFEVTFATVQALKDGYDVPYVAEAEKRAASAHGGN